MFIYESMNNFCKDFFKKDTWYFVAPFSLVAVVLIGVYYILTPVFMLFDLAVRMIDDLLDGNYDNVGGSVLVVRNIVGFIFIIPFYAVMVVLTIVLGLLYFLIYCFAFIGCCFKTNGDMFAFHNYFVSQKEKEHK